MHVHCLLRLSPVSECGRISWIVSRRMSSYHRFRSGGWSSAPVILTRPPLHMRLASTNCDATAEQTVWSLQMCRRNTYSPHCLHTRVHQRLASLLGSERSFDRTESSTNVIAP